MEDSEHPHRVQLLQTNAWNWSWDPLSKTKVKQVNELRVSQIATLQNMQLTSVEYWVGLFLQCTQVWTCNLSDLGGKWNVANHWVAAPGVVTWQAD